MLKGHPSVERTELRTELRTLQARTLITIHVVNNFLKCQGTQKAHYCSQNGPE
jgi:hypothetical protein